MTEPSILVVDDERIVSLDIQSALSRLGYRVAGCAASGAEAVALAASASPDLVLMDIRLAGGMDGTEAAVRIAQVRDVPVVFLTAYSDEDTMRRALGASPFGYLIKPFEDRELRGAIELALTKHAAERDLKRARRAAEEADHAKTAFLGTLSHELRTPMNGILGMAELLLLSDLDHDQRETVEHLKNCAQSFTGILNQLLDFSSLEAGVCDLGTQEFNLREFIDGVVYRYRAQTARKGLDFVVSTTDLPQVVVGAPNRMRQCLEHLLDNALAYTAKGCVRVTASAEPGTTPGSLMLLLRVADTGCGIAPEQLPLIFESFTQGEDFMTRRLGGLGLGLAMCRKVAECLGGSVCVESSADQGSVFTLRVPVQPVAPDGSAASRQSPLNGARVLVAEGQLAPASPLCRALALAGAQVLRACGGAAAAELLAESCVDAVVFTASLEGQTAAALTRVLRDRRTKAVAETPVLGVIASESELGRARRLDAGMDDVLAQTDDCGACLERLAELLARRSFVESRTTDRQGADAP
ncbi:ATP-binding response regulator [Humidesulfovibrio idahonensis]